MDLEKLKKDLFDYTSNQSEDRLNGHNAGSEYSPLLRKLSEFEPQEVKWLWPNKFPRGKISFLVGDPGVGKSYLSIAIAAHVTTGVDWPDGSINDSWGSVLIASAEDGIEDTIRVRADLAGADNEKIFILEGFKNEKKNENEILNLEKHIDDIDRILSGMINPKLIILDPITAYLGALDSHKNSQVRGLMASLAQVADRYDISILGISHLNKNMIASAIYRTMGSIAFVAAARSVWLVSIDGEDESNERRFFIPIKTNLSVNPTSHAFHIQEGKIVFEKEILKVTANQALCQTENNSNSVLENACEWVGDVLSAGPVFSDEIFRMGAANGFARRTLIRAKEKIGVKAIKGGSEEDFKWSWELP